MSLENKLKVLKEYLKSLNSVAVAFSSGVDSTFLLKIAHEVLGNNVTAFTAKSCLFPARELDEAVMFCKDENINHIIIENSIDDFSHNPKNRCYICKKSIFKKFVETAKVNKIEHIIEGSNIDDTKDYRPGMQAVNELDIKSPLVIAGLNKEEIRILSKNINIPTWEKPSFACLASRFVYGEQISTDKLLMVEKSEELLISLGFYQMRVRIHSNIARIEVMPEEFDKLLSVRKQVVSELKKYGFDYVTMDLIGYRTGSMNETLEIK